MITGWFLAHRHGQLRGMMAHRQVVDANKNGIDDRLEQPTPEIVTRNP